MTLLRLHPPSSVRSAFARGVALYERGYGGAGLRPETVRWARRIAQGEPVTLAKAKLMRAWLLRHGPSAREAARRLEDPTSPAAVAWRLWGATPSIPYARSGWRDPVWVWLKSLGRGAGFASVK